MDTRFLEGQLGYGVFNLWLQNSLDFTDKMKILKVILSQNEILVSSILLKNELENVDFCPTLLGQKFFVRLLGEKPFLN